MRNNSTFLAEVWKVFTKGNLLVVLFFAMCYTVMYIHFHIYIKDAFCILALLFCGYSTRKDKTSLWLLFFSITYSLVVFLKHNTGVYNSSYTELGGYLLGPVAFYIFGKYIVDKLDDKNLIETFLLLTIISLGAKVYYDLINDLSQGYLISVGRTFSMNEDFYLGATIVGTSISLGLVGFSAFVSINKPLKSLKAYLFLATNILSIFSVVYLLNRTGLFVFAICTIVTIVYMTRNKGLNSFLFVLLALSVVGYFVIGGLFNQEVVEAYEMRNASDVSSIGTGGGRFYRWFDALLQIPLHPFGWVADYGFVHNFWLDIARVAGIFPFVCIMVATIKATKTTFSLYKIKKDSLIAIIITLNVCFFFSSFVEPVLEGISTYVYLYCMLWGIQKRYYERIRFDSLNLV